MSIAPALFKNIKLVVRNHRQVMMDLMPKGKINYKYIGNK